MDNRRILLLRKLILGRIVGVGALPLGIPFLAVGWANLGIGPDAVPSVLSGLGGDIFSPVAGIGVFVAIGPALLLAGLVLILGALEALFSAFSAMFRSLNELPVKELSVDAFLVVFIVALSGLLSVWSYHVASGLFVG